MKKQILLIAILFCTAFAQAQEVFVTADFVSSYIWRGMDSGNASVQPSLGLNWKGLTVYAWGSTEFREKNNETSNPQLSSSASFLRLNVLSSLN